MYNHTQTSIQRLPMSYDLSFYTAIWYMLLGIFVFWAVMFCSGCCLYRCLQVNSITLPTVPFVSRRDSILTNYDPVAKSPNFYYPKPKSRPTITKTLSLSSSRPLTIDTDFKNNDHIQTLNEQSESDEKQPIETSNAPTTHELELSEINTASSDQQKKSLLSVNIGTKEPITQESSVIVDIHSDS